MAERINGERIETGRRFLLWCRVQVCEVHAVSSLRSKAEEQRTKFTT